MKSSEFITESIADIPQDVVERLGKLLIKPLRDRLLYAVSHPTFYILMDVFDEIFSSKTYAKSPRRDQAIDLLFPYVVQDLDRIIKDTKPNGYEFPFPLIRKLFKQNVENDAIAEIVDLNKDRLLAILTAFINKNFKSEHNIGRVRNEGEIVDIIKTLHNNGIDWPELDVLYKHQFTTRYNQWLDAGRDKWGTDTVYNVLHDMRSHNLTLNDLDDKVANRLISMKSAILNRSLFNLKYDTVSYCIRAIENFYKELERIGFNWPELQITRADYRSELNQFKTPIIRALLMLFKEQDVYQAARIIGELKSAVDWPEIAAMEKSLGNKHINEDLHPARIKAVDESLRNGDYIGAAHYMGVYGVGIDDFDSYVRERFEERKDDIIKEMLQVVKNISLDRSYKLISNVRKSGLGWPEIDIIFKSLDHSYTEKYR